jgi:hypothetical protein
LHEWAKEHHPGGPPATAGTIENKIRILRRQFMRPTK